MPQTYEPIATTTLSSTTANITFSSIPATYTHLRVVLKCIHDATFGANVLYQFNNDTSTAYSFTTLQGNGSGAASNRISNSTSGYTSGFQVSGWANIPTLHTLDIMAYKGSTNKTVLATYSGDNAPNSSDNYIQRSVLLWRNTSAINSIKLYLNAGSFVSGASATVYGIKAA